MRRHTRGTPDPGVVCRHTSAWDVGRKVQFARDRRESSAPKGQKRWHHERNATSSISKMAGNTNNDQVTSLNWNKRHTTTSVPKVSPTGHTRQNTGKPNSAVVSTVPPNTQLRASCTPPRSGAATSSRPFRAVRFAAESMGASAPAAGPDSFPAALSLDRLPPKTRRSSGTGAAPRAERTAEQKREHDHDGQANQQGRHHRLRRDHGLQPAQRAQRRNVGEPEGARRSGARVRRQTQAHQPHHEERAQRTQPRSLHATALRLLRTALPPQPLHGLPSTPQRHAPSPIPHASPPQLPRGLPPSHPCAARESPLPPSCHHLALVFHAVFPPCANRSGATTTMPRRVPPANERYTSAGHAFSHAPQAVAGRGVDYRMGRLVKRNGLVRARIDAYHQPW